MDDCCGGTASRRIVLTSPAHQEQRQALEGILAPFGGIAFLFDAGEDPDARAAMLSPAEILLSWDLGEDLTPAELAALGQVRLVQLLSAGADHVDFGALPPGALVAGNVGAYADPMAEHVLGMTLALAKRLARGHASLAAGTFESLRTLRLRGKVAGILGYGGIGSACARLYRALGMSIYAINTTGRPDEHADRAGTLASLPGMLAEADVLVVALPLTRATRSLIAAPELAMMKTEAILVNVARGPIVDEDALFAHLQAHPEFCAGIDTWWEEPGRGEPFRPRLPFLGLPNVLGSPHNSGMVAGIGTEAMAAAGRNVAAFLRGGPLRGRQDPADYAGQPT